MALVGLPCGLVFSSIDDHLNLDEHFGAEEDWRRIVEEDIHRNVSEDIVILINRGTFRGHEGVALAGGRGEA